MDYRPPKEVMQRNKRQLHQFPGLDKVTCKALFVAGEKEPKAVNQSNVMLAGIMPNAQSRMAPGMGHGWLAEAPDLHCRTTRAWINDEALPQELQEVGPL